MAFPQTPSNGDTYTNDGGTLFQYVAADNKWRIVGTTGIMGYTGLDGAKGDQGDTGVAGVDGATGVAGVAGETGVVGAQGQTGAAGVAGATGVAGVQGSTGAAGAQGATGAADASSSVPVGTVLPFAGATGPTGYLICDGSMVSDSTYAGLKAVIGTTYGSTGTWFAVPNLKGRVIAGYDSGNAKFNAMGFTGGAETHTLLTAELAAHAHTVTINRARADSAGNAIGGGFDGVDTVNGIAKMANAGSGSAHNNLQPYIALNYIIKT